MKFTRSSTVTKAKHEHIFIAHLTEDDLFVDQIVADLQRSGIEAYVDHKSIPLGVYWEVAIEDALKNSKAVLIVLSPNSIQSNNVRAEWNLALEMKKPVYTILIKGFKRSEIPFRLSVFQWADFSRDYDKGIGSLVKALDHFFVA